MAKKSTGRTPRARTVGKVTTAKSSKVRPSSRGVAPIAKPIAKVKLASKTIVAAPALKPRTKPATATATPAPRVRPPLGVMPGMRALSRTSTVMGVAPTMIAPAPIIAVIAPPRDELTAPRDVGRLLRYGERFGDHRIDIRMLPLQLPASSGAFAIADPSAPKSWRVFDRPIPAGQFRVMLSLAKLDDIERLAAIVIHVGRPPIAKWTVAHYRGHKAPRSPDALPRVPITGGWIALADGGAPIGTVAMPASPVGLAPIEVGLPDGRRVLAFPCPDGDHAAYWAIDGADKPVCLVIELEIFKAKDWKIPKA